MDAPVSNNPAVNSILEKMKSHNVQVPEPTAIFDILELRVPEIRLDRWEGPLHITDRCPVCNEDRRYNIMNIHRACSSCWDEARLKEAGTRKQERAALPWYRRIFQ